MSGFQFSIDRGGTFTDVYCLCPDGSERTLKLLSHDPTRYKDAPTEAIRRILHQETGATGQPDSLVDSSGIEWIRMGTTIATNALLERKGARVALLITKGFRDLLHIGTQARPHLFDLSITGLSVDCLYETVVEVEERLVVDMESCQMNLTCPQVTSVSGRRLWVYQSLDPTVVQQKLIKLLDQGISSLAVVFLHSHLYPDHEVQVGDLARRLGFGHVSLSHQVMSMARVVPRGMTTVLDAYLTPCINQYINDFRAGFSGRLQDVNVLFMRSDGGLTPMDEFSGCGALLSGPAAGVVGYAETAPLSVQRHDHQSVAVIGFDMGGTSTDVSRYRGQYQHVFEATTAGVMVQTPQLDINTVAAGGGSLLRFRDGMFCVGPESAGADPGPVCYRKGGSLTVTDANLVLGRIQPRFFPSIFGPHENLPLDYDTTLAEFHKLTAQVNQFRGAQVEGEDCCERPLSVYEVALGFIDVANEAMCRPIRSLTQARGHDVTDHVLACFGGAGGQHACSVARNLGMTSVFIHKYSGILSAFGLSMADVVTEKQEPFGLVYSPDNFQLLDERLETLQDLCRTKLETQGFQLSQIVFEQYLHLRYDGTDCALMVRAPSSVSSPNSSTRPRHGDFLTAFLNRYKVEFGFQLASDRPVIIDDVRVRARGQTKRCDTKRCEEQRPGTDLPTPSAVENVDVFFGSGFRSVAVYKLEELSPHQNISGPAIVLDSLSTILIEPGCSAEITAEGDVHMHVSAVVRTSLSTRLDPILLAVYSHRFMSLAEQMGRILQRSAVSTNIKERLDFSCAVFGPDGGLVSNAPHIPVHLGAMQEAVQYQVGSLGDDLSPGDVILSNHPIAGGTHLPDLTVITPVFYSECERPVFFVASRGHHADIGGISPGSMPSHSTSLEQEGVCFVSFKLVKAGVFQEEALIEALMAPGKIEGSSGSRNLRDNISDLRAQVAANQKGVVLVNSMIERDGLPVVQAYMEHVRRAAELAVRQLLRDVGERAVQTSGSSNLRFSDCMDDGSVIKLSVDIDVTSGSAVFDFSGTGYEVCGNWNAPRAITISAIIYCLRCMVGHDIPLNEGCMVPVSVRVPDGCLLSPSPTAAVVGGNVLTSQRVVDVVLGAFSAAAASCGCMNNISLGDDSIGYYETVAGGSGAGPQWHGRGGVHTHMTNTRITDPELLESRYPLLLKTFSLRPNSGGNGRYRGGDGVERALLFRKPLSLSVLTERRVFRPYGLLGGEPGSPGENLLVRSDGRVINLGAKASLHVQTGDVFRMFTPGGGGYGSEL